MLKIEQSEMISDEFLDYLLKFIVSRGVYLSSKIELSVLDDELSTLGIKQSAKQIIISILHNVEIYKYKGYFRFQLNKNVLCYGTNYKLIDLYKLIESGNTTCKGIHLMSFLFKYVENHIDVLYEKFLMGG